MAWATNAITEGRARFRIGSPVVLQMQLLEQVRPTRPCGRGMLCSSVYCKDLRSGGSAPPWPILSVAAVLLALCRLVDDFAVFADAS